MELNKIAPVPCTKHDECGLEYGHDGKCCVVVTCDDMDRWKASESKLGTLSAAVRKAWFAKREGEMWQALGAAMDLVDPARKEAGDVERQ